MKKYLLVVFCTLFLVLLAGCGKKNQVVCSGTLNEGGMTINAEVIANLDKDNKVTDASVVYDLGDSKTAETYCSFFKLMEDSEKGISISCSGSKITITGYAKAAGETEEESLEGASKEDFIKAMEAQKLTCK